MPRLKAMTILLLDLLTKSSDEPNASQGTEGQEIEGNADKLNGKCQVSDKKYKNTV